MKKLRKALILLGILSFTGCADFSSPSAVIGTFAEAVLKSDFKLYLKTLEGEALKSLGTEKQMQLFQKAFLEADVHTGRAKLVKTEKDFRGWDIERNYTVEVQTQQKSVTESFTVGVRCEVGYIYGRRNDMPNPTDPAQDCSGGWSGRYGYCNFMPSEDCHIASLRPLF